MSSGPQSVWQSRDDMEYEKSLKEFNHFKKEELQVLNIYLLYFLQEKL